MLRLPVVYAPLRQQLALIQRRAELLRWLAEHDLLPGALLDDVALATALLTALGSLIDIHDADIEMMIEIAREENRPFDLDTDMPLMEVIHLDGIDEDRDWDSFSLLWQFAVCLTFAGAGFGNYDFVTAVWWSDHAAALRLPHLTHLEYSDIESNLADLPAPWDGLLAILNWLKADTGNEFVDIPCEYALGYLYGLEWTAADLNRVVSAYQEAERTIFHPAAALEEEFRRQPALTLRRCADLALGRVDYLVQDGEIVWLDEPDVPALTNQPVNSYKETLVYA